jgi:hypothetical protein
LACIFVSCCFDDCPADAADGGVGPVSAGLQRGQRIGGGWLQASGGESPTACLDQATAGGGYVFWVVCHASRSSFLAVIVRPFPWLFISMYKMPCAVFARSPHDSSLIIWQFPRVSKCSTDDSSYDTTDIANGADIARKSFAVTVFILLSRPALRWCMNRLDA